MLKRLALLGVVAVLVPACAGGTSKDRFAAPPAPIPFPAVLFLADAAVNAEQQLFATDLTGSSIVDLSGPLVSGGSVISFLWSPDREWVAFIAEKETVGVRELHVVPAAGGTPVKVSRPLVAGGNVQSAEWAPDGSRIAYMADAEVNDVTELYTTFPNGAGATAKINGTLVLNGDVLFFKWAPDGSRIAFSATQDIATSVEIFTASPDGPSTNVKIHPALPAGRSTNAIWFWSPDSSRIAYMADQDTDSVAELYASAPDGTANVKINATLFGGGVGVIGFDFSWLPNSSRVVYRAQQDALVMELYSTLADGTGNVKLNGTLVAGGDVSDFKVAPDSARVLYAADQDTDGLRELYTSLPGGGGNVKINGPVLTATAGNESWSPDGSRIAYVADQDAAGVMEFYTAPAAGGGNVKLNGPLVAGGNVVSQIFQWSPDSSRVSYVADQDVNDDFELYTSGAGGGGNVRISGPLVVGGDVNSIPVPRWSTNGTSLVYMADVAVDDFVELFVSPRAGPADSVRISGPMIAFGSDVTGFQVR